MKFVRTLCTVASFACLAFPAMSQTVPFKVPASALAQGATGQCSFIDKKLPRNTIVVAAGSYSSNKRLGFALDQSGHAAGQFDVGVHSDKPIALMLAAYDPTVWNIGWTKGTRIVAVFVTGYLSQRVAGLPAGTPLIVSSGSGARCGQNYISKDNLGWVNERSKDAFGVEATRVYDRASAGFIDITESTRPKGEYETSNAVTIESLKDVNLPLAGTAGLDDAVAKGLIRAATEADISEMRAAYKAAAAAQPKAAVKSIPPIAGQTRQAEPEVRYPQFSLTRGYVVLKAFEIPSGLYGGNLAYFIVPKGVPAPSGNPGHSMVVDLNRVNCAGPMCR